MKPVSQNIFRAYDIRGIVDKDFDQEWVLELGRACGTFFKNKGFSNVIIGRDCRHSSPDYADALCSGLNQSGVDVLCLGMVPTPVFYYAVKVLDRKAGIMVTASHNPKEYNGFKLWSGESTMEPEEIQQIWQIMHDGNFSKGKGVCSEHDIRPGYLEDLAAKVALKSSPTVVVDGGNGAAGELCAELLTRAGANVIKLFCEPDGNFPNHHPDPVVEKNILQLKEKVKETGADCGIGLDGDGDRIGVVDELGNMVTGERLTAILAREILSRKPGALFLADVKCTHLLFKDVEQHGGKAQMAVTGHSFMKAKLRETGAELAGEMSGHLFFNDRFYGVDDGLYAALRIVEILASAPNKPLSTYLSDWPATAATPEIRMECPEQIKFALVERAVEYFKERYPVIDVDGVRITLEDGWALLRASNTQPVLVLRFEAETENRLQELRNIVEKPLLEWIREMAPDFETSI